MRQARRPVGVVVLGAVLLGGLVLAGCAGAEQSGSPAHRVKVWATGSDMGSDVGTVIADAATVVKAERLHKGAGTLHAICSALSTDAEAGNQELPTPNQALTNELAKAYQLEFTAGNDCYNGAGGNQRLLITSARDRRRAQALFTQAVAQVHAIAGISVSTTTTTTPGGGDLGDDLF